MHVCIYQDYFVPGTFVPFKTEDGYPELDGFGTVVLRAVRAKNGRDAHVSEITLRRVFLRRSDITPANVLSQNGLLDDLYDSALQHSTKKLGRKRPSGTFDGWATKEVADLLCDIAQLNMLRLEGQEELSTGLSFSRGRRFGYQWNEKAREKFKSFITLRSQIENPPPSLPDDPPVVVSKEDKAWLRGRVGMENAVGLIEEFAASPTFAATIRHARLRDA